MNRTQKLISTIGMGSHTLEFSLNYTKLATLPTKTYTGKSKKNSAKKIASSGDRTQNLWIFALMTELSRRVG